MLPVSKLLRILLSEWRLVLSFPHLREGFGCLGSAKSGNTGLPAFQLPELLLLGPHFLFSLSLRIYVSKRSIYCGFMGFWRQCILYSCLNLKLSSISFMTMALHRFLVIHLTIYLINPSSLVGHSVYFYFSLVKSKAAMISWELGVGSFNSFLRTSSLK